MQNKFLISRIDNAKDLPLPQYMTENSAGMDLYANVDNEVGVLIKSGEIKLIPTGIIISIPNGFEAQVRPRSGLALNHGITMANSIGTIDADYRGEIKVIAINNGNEDFLVTRGMRIAQMVINKVEIVKFQEVEQLDETSRGCRGFGHTGI